MRMAQMELETQGRKLHRHVLPSASHTTEYKPSAGTARADESTTTRTTASKSDDETRAPTLAQAVHSVRPPPQYQRGFTMPTAQTLTSQVPSHHSKSEPDSGDTDIGSTFFPTLWKPDSVTSSWTKYRQPQQTFPSSPASNSATSQEGANASERQQHNVLRSPRRPPKAAAPSTGGLIISQGLSEFDLRKCHPTPDVTAQHGFLLEQNISQLIEDTGYDRSELYALWTRFKALCSIAQSPKGIDKETFRRGIPQLSLEDQFFIDRVFDILDADGSGILEWQEFVEVLSAVEKGDASKRINFLFRVYDLNGDGTILRNEVMQFFLASLLVTPTEDLIEVAKHFIDKIFEAVGCQGREAMRVQDAIQYMQDHPSSDIYSLFGRTMVTKRVTRLKWAAQEPLSPKAQLSPSREGP